MLRPIVIPLTFLVATAGLFVAWYVEASVPFFPSSLQGQILKCSEGPQFADYEVSVLDDFEAEWFAGELRGLREKPLHPVLDAKSDTLRFTWLRSFHAPVVVRADRLPDGSVRLNAKRLAGEGGCSLQGEGCEVSRTLKAAEITRLEEVRRAALAAPAQVCGGGLDGARWIVESTEDGGYRFAQRFTPQDGAIRELGLTMIGMTGWRFDRVY
ncbi:hypothetical protein BrevBR_09505 [Brevundimonas sp. BR2-1]|uniref:hypothetical protein n=1 Tax=Brevundimonas sp. BR2-1 TaxID=3031123 RepID=UPI0030B3898E